MRIVYILPYLGIGGTEKHVLDLIRGIDREHEIILLAPEGETLDEFKAQRVDYYSFPRLDLQPLPGIRTFRRQLKAICAQHTPDLLHIHGAPELVLLARMAVRKFPIVFTLHGLHGPREDWDYWACAKITNRFASRVIAVSNAEAELLRAKGGKLGLLEMIHNGVPDPLQSERRHSAVDTSEVKNPVLECPIWHRPELMQEIPRDKVIIGTVARLEELKGINYLIDAFALVQQTHPNIHLIIVGAGSKEEELKEQVNKLGISADVTFTGYQRNSGDYLHHCDIVAMPSLLEALSLVLVEALGHGKPCIGTMVGGIPEVVEDGVNGFLVPPASAGALAGALEQLLADAGLRARMGENARVVFERKFTLERMIEKTLRVYQEVVALK